MQKEVYKTLELEMKNKIQSKILYENSRNLILHIKGVNLISQKGVKIFNNILKNFH